MKTFPFYLAVCPNCGRLSRRPRKWLTLYCLGCHHTFQPQWTTIEGPGPVPKVLPKKYLVRCPYCGTAHGTNDDRSIECWQCRHIFEPEVFYPNEKHELPQDGQSLKAKTSSKSSPQDQKQASPSQSSSSPENSNPEKESKEKLIQTVARLLNKRRMLDSEIQRLLNRISITQ